jgi:dTDP-4-dehydrorhamnose reductase
MKILLLGSTGQLGTAIMRCAKNEKVECVGFGREKFEISHIDEVIDLIDKIEPNVLINAVALQAIEKCERYKQDAFSINGIAIDSLARICESREIVLVQLSTHTVFDGRKNAPYVESDVPCPINTYGMSKLVGDLYTINLCSKHYVLRLPTVFGPRQEGYEGFCDKLSSWVSKEVKLRMADDKIDSFGYSEDISKEIIRILLDQEPYGIYHVTNSGGCSYYTFTAEYLRLIGKPDYPLDKALDKEFPCSGKKPKKTELASEKLRPLRSWQTALADFVRRTIH